MNHQAFIRGPLTKIQKFEIGRKYFVFCIFFRKKWLKKIFTFTENPSFSRPRKPETLWFWSSKVFRNFKIQALSWSPFEIQQGCIGGWFLSISIFRVWTFSHFSPCFKSFTTLFAPPMKIEFEVTRSFDKFESSW